MQYNISMNERSETYSVKVGNINIGSKYPIRIQSMTNTIGDAIVVKGANGINFLRVRTEWTGGPKESNGAYGFYPVQSTDVLIDGCIAIGASDAGIYVGQSERIKVLNNIQEDNEEIKKYSIAAKNLE